MTSERATGQRGRSPVSEGHLQGQPRIRLEFHSEDLAKPFRERIDEDVTITVDSIVQLPDGTHLQYWTVTDGVPTNVIETAIDFPTTIDARLLSSAGGTHRVEVHGASRSLFSTFGEFDGVTRSAVYDQRAVDVVADFPPHVDADEVAAAVRSVYPDLRLVSSSEIQTASVLRPLVHERLTDRQRTALQLAYFGGYYEQPRRITGEELAARMGISKQAFHEHLRKAYSTVLEQLLEGGDGSMEVD